MSEDGGGTHAGTFQGEDLPSFPWWWCRGGAQEKGLKKNPVNTFNELFTLLDEAINAGDSLNDSDDVDKAPGSATVASTPMAVAPVVSAPVVDTTTTGAEAAGATAIGLEATVEDPVTLSTSSESLKESLALIASSKEANKASDSLKDSDDVDKEPVSATVASTSMADASVASAPVLATTASSRPAVAFSGDDAAAVLPASSGGGDVEPDIDDDLCSPVAMAAFHILYSNLELKLDAKDYNNVLVFTADDEVGV